MPNRHFLLRQPARGLVVAIEYFIFCSPVRRTHLTQRTALRTSHNYGVLELSPLVLPVPFPPPTPEVVVVELAVVALFKARCWSGLFCDELVPVPDVLLLWNRFCSTVATWFGSPLLR